MAKEENLDNLKKENSNLKEKEAQGELTDADRARLKQLEDEIPNAREEAMKQELEDLHNAAQMKGPLSQADRNKSDDHKENLKVTQIAIRILLTKYKLP